MNWEEELESLFNEPIFDDVKAAPAKITSADRLIASFLEINDFYEKNNRLPSANGAMDEKIFLRRLEAITLNEDKKNRCLPYDRFHLLQSKEMNVEDELDNIFKDPVFATNEDTNSIFNVPEHLIKTPDRANADFVARRKKCENFEDYKQIFTNAHYDLKMGNRTILKFNEAQLIEGTIFIVDGVLVLLNKIYEAKKDKNHKIDGRTHCVFENGTESNMMLRSLGKALYINGQTISESKQTNDYVLKQNFSPTADDLVTGYIYVLKSKSDNPAISQYKDLYKIGFTTTTVEERVAHAAKQTTYLLSDVEIIATWKAYNLNVSYFENMLHKLFDQVRLQVKIYHDSGTVITPEEWFIVPLPIIRSAVGYIMNQTQVSYNAELQMIETY